MPVRDRRSLLGAMLEGLAGDLFGAQPTQAAPIPTPSPKRREISKHRIGASCRGTAAPAVLVAPRPLRLPPALVTFMTLPARRREDRTRLDAGVVLPRRSVNVLSRQTRAQPSAG